jgi:hypothetical protein
MVTRFPGCWRWISTLLVMAAPLSCGEAKYTIPRVANRCSLHLDGDDDFLDLGVISAGQALLLSGKPFTLSAWFRQEAGGDPYQRIIDKSEGALAKNGWALAADPGERRIHFYVHNGQKGGDFISARGAYGLEQWHQVTAVARAARLEIWIDGRKDPRSSYESGSFQLPAAAATAARIGTWNHDQGREFKGWLDEISVWDTDLSAAAIEALHAAGGCGDLLQDWGPYRFSKRLVAWWRMEETASGDPGPRVADSSGRGVAALLRPDATSGNAPRIDCESVPR